MNKLLRIVSISLLGAALNVHAGSLVATFDNDFGSAAQPVNEIFIWKDAGLNALSSHGFGGALSGWSAGEIGTALVLSGPAVTAPNTGTYTLRFNFAGAAVNAPAYQFQWAEVFFDGTTRQVRGAGTTGYSGSNSGSYGTSSTFTHLNSTDIPGLVTNPAPVPLPSSIVLLLSTLVFAPVTKLRRRHTHTAGATI